MIIFHSRTNIATTESQSLNLPWHSLDNLYRQQSRRMGFLETALEVDSPGLCPSDLDLPICKYNHSLFEYLSGA